MSEVRCKKHDWHTEHVECAACVAEKIAVYDAAMDWMGELEALFGGLTMEELEKEMTPCAKTLYRVCRRAKEGR